MARNFQINGESLVSVKGNVNTGIATLSQLGLAEGPIRVSLELNHEDIQVDAWGGRVPPETQFMLAAANISMSLVHVDRDVLEDVIGESMGGAAAEGTLWRAGTRMGGGGARFAVNNHFVGLNIYSPVQSLPWRFYYTYLTGTPVEIPLGTSKSIFSLTFRCIPYAPDPWNNGLGAQGYVLFDHVLDV